MENFFAIGLRATFGPRSEAELAFGNPCAKRALHTVENFCDAPECRREQAPDFLSCFRFRLAFARQPPIK